MSSPTLPKFSLSGVLQHPLSNLMNPKDMNHDPMGSAIADFHHNRTTARLRVFADDFDEDEMPVHILFRTYDQMPEVEQTALHICRGHTLDVGAAAGPHSLHLQTMGKRVTAIDLSPRSVTTMTERGVKDAQCLDFWDVRDRYDTILMLMNGIGIVGTIDRLPQFFAHIDTILAPNGQVICDSTDVRYLYQDQDGSVTLPQDKYYGHFVYRMKYKRAVGRPFSWLFIDFETLAQHAAQHGFDAKLIQQGISHNYLAQLTRSAE